MKFILHALSCTVVCLCFSVSLVEAQSSDAVYFVPSVYPKSPNVASFAKYGDYQVNLFTGVPDISIPLYTVEAGGLKLPIALSYHASGNKLTDVSSWVGLGWSIPGGGAVSRRVMGGADDGPYGYMTTYVHNASTLDMTVDSDMLYVDKIANGTYDGRPDIYSYDFPGHSGKFFLDGANKFTPVIVPYAPVNIKYTYVAPVGSMVKALTNFTLTDESGDIFKFGDAATEMTETSGAGNNSSAPQASSWMMENMISQNRRDTISFAYGSDVLLYPDASSQMIAVTDGVANYGTPPYPYNPNVSQVNTTSTSSSVTELPMQQINFKNGKVVFDPDATVRQDINLGGASNNVYGLSDIKVYAYDYSAKVMTVQKTIKFYKSYFGTTAANNLRLRLDSIQVLDAAGAIIQHYRFGYNTGITLPYYGNFARDYWGYYNGKDASTSLIPQQTVPFNGGTTSIGGSIANNRDPDSLHMQAYMLDTIYYPTGGHTIFTYQTNQYLNNVGALRIAGGLRISSIKSYDGFSTTPIVKSYVYNTADSNFFLSYHYFAAPLQTHRYYVSVSSGGATEALYFCNVHNYVSNPNIDLEPWDAAAVVYPSVTEYYGTPGNNVGYSSYSYTYESDDTQDGSMVGTPVITSYYYNRGKLLNKSDYLRTGSGTYQIVKSVSNTYQAFPEKQYLNIGFMARKIYSNDGLFGNTYPILYSERTFVNPTDVSSYLLANYWIYSTDNYLTSTTENIYDTTNPSNYTTSTSTYVYGDTTHLQIAKTIHVDSKGNTHITVNKYPFDYLNGGTTHNTVLDSMINRHMYAEPVEKWDTLKNVATSVNAVTGAQLNQYTFGHIGGTIVPSTISTLSVSVPLTNFVPASVVSGVLTGDSRYVQMISFDAYDTQNNIAQYTPRNATPTTILWDYLHELPIAQVKNAAISSSFYTSFEADGNGGWTYSGTPIVDVTAPTGSKVYPLSAGNITLNTYTNTKANILSYWSNGGVATVTCGSSIAGTALVSNNGWTYYEHTIPSGATSAITISGSTSIDELRMYPVDAQMTTYTYNPAGLTSIADTKGSISHFEYDYFQRLKNMKDWAGNIVKNYGYHTYDQTIGNQVQTNTFTRNNCPVGTTPGSTGFTVPANKYYSSTLASANAEAIYDMNTNGQIKANQVCGCPVTTTAFTLSNSTGSSLFQATFSGIATPYNFPSSGSTIIYVPVGTYTTISVNSSANVYTFSLTGFTDVVGHSASFGPVSVTTGSNLTLSIH